MTGIEQINSLTIYYILVKKHVHNIHCMKKVHNI